MDFAALLHFTEKGGVLLASRNQEEAAGFAVESAYKGKKLLGIVIAEPVDESEGAVGTCGVNEPSRRFIDDQERGMFQDYRRTHKRRLVQRVVWVKCKIGDALDGRTG